MKISDHKGSFNLILLIDFFFGKILYFQFVPDFVVTISKNFVKLEIKDHVGFLKDFSRMRHFVF